MTRTVLQLITDALTEIGVVGEGVALEDDDAQLALRHLQNMHDSMHADRLMLFTVARSTFTLAANLQTRTIGDGGNFDTGAGTERPVFVAHVGVTPVGQTYELEIVPYLTREAWLAEAWKSLTNTYPYRYLYEPTYPLGTFTFWPIQDTAPTVAISIATRLTSPAALNTSLVFPPGYHDAWLYNVATRLARPFRKAVDQDLREDARKALSLIKRLNDPGPPPAQFDIVATGGYDIESNRYR